MAEAYYGHSTPAVTKPPTVIPLPSSNSPLSFRSAIFGGKSQDALSLSSPEKLATETCILLYIGKNLDGLPLLLNITRSHSIKSKVLSGLGVTDENQLPQLIKQRLIDLENAVQQRSCLTGIYEVNHDTKLNNLGNVNSYYRTSNCIANLLKATTYSRFTGDSSVSNLNERGEGYKEALLDKETQMYLGIIVTGDTALGPLAVKINPSETKLEPLLLENVVNTLPSTKFLCTEQTNRQYSRGYSSYDLPTTNNAYTGLLSDRNLYYQALNLAGSLTLQFDRQEFAMHVIVPLARKVYETMHKQNRVHADIKPANILLLENGPILIDVRGCSVGNIAASYTPRWCSPEQTLGKPVSTASDVYSLGLLALQLVSGQLYGEIKRFRVPSASGGESVIEVLDIDGVFIDPNFGLNEIARQAWRNTLARFLAFDPLNRPKDGNQFADEFQILLTNHPLTDIKRMEISAGIGSANLRRIAVPTDAHLLKLLKDPNVQVQCEAYPAWVMDDTYASIS